MNKNDVVYETCLLIVRHFRNLVAHNGYGFNTRIFSHMLHPEKEFVLIGTSIEAAQENRPYPEHVVPCAVLISECRRLISEGYEDAHIAKLLQKHWKIAHITKEQAKTIDTELGLKSVMPSGWNFETGSTLARLEKADIRFTNS